MSSWLDKFIKIIFRERINTVQRWLFKGKVILLQGARQVGKTTICQSLIAENQPTIYLNCERIQIKELLESKQVEQIRNYLAITN